MNASLVTLFPCQFHMQKRSTLQDVQIRNKVVFKGSSWATRTCKVCDVDIIAVSFHLGMWQMEVQVLEAIGGNAAFDIG